MSKKRVLCPGCGKLISESEMKLSTYSVRNRNVIDIGRVREKVPKEASFLDSFYCTCKALIKWRFRQL